MPRTALIVLSVIAIFCLVTGLLWWLLPYPRRNVDYLVIGGMGTMVSMGALFLILIRTSYKGEDVFFKRSARKPPEDV